MEQALGLDSLIDMDFMTSRVIKSKKLGGDTVRISRCGYTGEDGFEVSISQKSVWPFVEDMLNQRTLLGG